MNSLSNPLDRVTEEPGAPSPRPDSRAFDDEWSALALAVAAIMVGRAIQLNLGLYDVTALVWLAGALAVCLCVVFVKALPRLPRLASQLLDLVLLGGVAAEIFVHIKQIPYALTMPAQYLPFKAAVGVAFCFLCAIVWGPARHRNWFFATVVLLWMFAATLTIRNANPHIDIIPVHQESISALLHGADPYGITLPIIYNASEQKQFYVPTDIRNNRLQYGFPYPPLSLLLSVPGQVLAGDYRYGMMLAVAVAAWLMANTNSFKAAKCAAALFLFTPKGIYVVAMGWTEPLLVLLLAATAFCAVRYPRILPYVFGLFLSVKQYLAPVLIASVMLVKPLRRKAVFCFWKKAALIAIAVTLPFVLWNYSAFIHTFSRSFPLRPEALSFNSLLFRLGIYVPAWLLPLPAMAVAALLARRIPLTPSGFAASIGIFYLFLFVFAKLAFCNYYYFIIAAFCIAVATSTTEQQDVALS
jgi:hypothetical protein